jgi:hypothetical protein
MRPVLCVCILALPVLAQIPGQGPFPGGGGPYPGGRNRYPNGGNGTGTNGGGQPEGRKSSRDKGKDQPVVTTTEGLLRRAVSRQIVIEADDHRIIWYHVADKMVYQDGEKDLDPKALTPGDHVSVDSTADEQGVYTAVSLTRRSAGTAQDRFAASHDWDLPPVFTGTQTASAQTPRAVTRDPGDERPVLRRSKPAGDDSHTEDSQTGDSQKAPEKADAAPQSAPRQDVQQAAAAPPAEPEDTRSATTIRPPDPKPDQDDPGRPVLKRGGPAQRRMTTQSDSPSPAPAPAPATQATVASRDTGGPGPRLGAAAPPARDQNVPIEDDPVIAKAREAAVMYLEGLPNFFAKQMTTRYATENVRQGWQAQDVITADVAYEDGHESYKNIRIGNKPTNKSMEDLPGTRSSGEFATLLIQVMDPASQATFRRGGTDTVHGRSAFTYKFEVTRTLSRWRVESPSELYYPAYGGTIWIDRETSRVVRIEQDARKIPPLFPFDTIETTADYDYVRLETQSFLLPVESEVLSCQRGSSVCSRNKIEFRNYRKFGAESDITFDTTVK